jgi:tetratricopeptide (TPR) repeat protein
MSAHSVKSHFLKMFFFFTAQSAMVSAKKSLRVSTSLVGLLLALFISPLAQAQSDSLRPIEFNGDIGKWVSKLSYPAEAQKNNIAGKVIFQLTISESGRLDSLNLIASPSKLLTEACIYQILETNGRWKPAQLNGKAVRYRSQLVIDFILSKENQRAKYDFYQAAEKYFQKSKYRKALTEIDQAIEMDPYADNYVSLRANIKDKLGDQAGAEADRLKAQVLQKEVILVITIMGYSVVERRQLN